MRTRLRKTLLAGVTGLLVLVAGMTAAEAATYPNPGVVTGSTWAHDPAIVKRPSGGYLMATTGSGITLKTSADRTRFTDAGRAFPGGTPWANTYTNGDANLWAPDLSYRNGRYVMYYSASHSAPAGRRSSWPPARPVPPAPGPTAAWSSRARRPVAGTRSTRT